MISIAGDRVNVELSINEALQLQAKLSEILSHAIRFQAGKRIGGLMHFSVPSIINISEDGGNKSKAGVLGFYVAPTID